MQETWLYEDLIAKGQATWEKKAYLASTKISTPSIPKTTTEKNLKEEKSLRAPLTDHKNPKATFVRTAGVI